MKVSNFFQIQKINYNFLTLFQSYDVAKGFVDNWIPRCYRQKTPCSVIFQFHHTLASKYDKADKSLPISK
jgi:hypothetical protein